MNFVATHFITYLLTGSTTGSTSSTSSLTATLASTIVQAAASGQTAPVAAAAAAAAGYGQFMDPSYWQQYGGWQGYGYQGYGYDQQAGYAAPYAGQMPAQPEEDEFELIEHSNPIDVDKLNKEFFDRNQDLWDAVEECRWTPFLPEKVVPTQKTEENGTATSASTTTTTAAVAAA